MRFTVAAERVESASSLLWDSGTTGIFEDGGHLVAGFDGREQAEEAMDRLRGMATDVESIEPYRWEGSDRATTVTVPVTGGREGPLVIVAGPTFGHGGHPTTAMALELLADTVRPGHRVLDVGTGSGVLAVAAAALGAEPVVAIDIDPATVDVALANASSNGVTITVGLVPVSATPGLIGNHLFDVLVANVLLPAHRELAGSMAGVLAPGGVLITAGYLAEDEAAVESLHLGALARPRRSGRARVEARRSIDGWAAHRFWAAG